MRKLTLAVLAALFAVPAWAEESTGTITIPVAEYERLKKAVEADGDEQYWNMTFQQILDKKNNDEAKAWELYEFYVLRTVHLNEIVTDSVVETLIGEIQVLNEIDAEKPVTMVVNSPGGSVFAGLNLYNAMLASEAPVNTVCDGMAMSMAAVLLSAGDKRTARQGCVFMVHEVAGGSPGGQTTDQIKTADIYISIDDVLLTILSENSGLSVADVLKLYEFETWWNAEETLALGFVDAVTGAKPREVVAGTRSIPAELMPRERMTRRYGERLGE